MTVKLGGRWRALWIRGAVLFSLLVFVMSIGCGRKKPPMPLKQDTAQLVVGWKAWGRNR